MKRLLGILGATFLALPAFAAKPAPVLHAPLDHAQMKIVRASRHTDAAKYRPLAISRQQIASTGIYQNLAVVGRLHGAGNVLYVTTVDIQNNSNSDSSVDFFFDGVSGGTTISVTGSIQNLASGNVASYSDAHYDDFIDVLANTSCGNSPCITPSEESAGVLGSMLVVFNDLDSNFSGEGYASARFYSTAGADTCSFAGGTIGVSARSELVTTNNSMQLVGLFRDTRGEGGVPQLYANMFVNNIGYSQSGTYVGDTDVVLLYAYSNATGSQVGVTGTLTIGPGLTAVVSDVLGSLQVPLSEDTILVFAVVDQGFSAIQGIAVQVDDTTKDGSAIAMHDAAFY